MFSTVEDALMKWCPMVRYTESGHCIGSACMMWRWGAWAPRRVWAASNTAATTEAEAGPQPDWGLGWDFISAVVDDDGIARWVESDRAYVARHEGYCGLAGRPEVKP